MSKKKWQGSKSLESLLVPISKLSHDPENLNNHTNRSVGVLKSSLTRFGQQKPVVIVDNVVRAGNGMLEAAKSLGWSHLAVSEFEGTELEAKAFGIADNQSTRHSFFKDDIIEHVVGLMGDFSPDELGGWDPGELQGIEFPEGDGFDDEVSDEDEGARVDTAKSIRVTQDQWEVISEAVERVRDEADDHTSEGRCLELICADYLSGMKK